MRISDWSSDVCSSDLFPFLPSGCHMQLDAVATTTVLDNIRRSLPSKWPAKARELKRIAETTSDITLKRFLEASGLELVDVYAGNHSWSDLLEAGGVLPLPSGPEELTLRRALGRLLHLEDSQRIKQYRRFAHATQPTRLGALEMRTPTL